jgi:hypothetical protein
MARVNAEELVTAVMQLSNGIRASIHSPTATKIAQEKFRKFCSRHDIELDWSPAPCTEMPAANDSKLDADESLRGELDLLKVMTDSRLPAKVGQIRMIVWQDHPGARTIVEVYQLTRARAVATFNELRNYWNGQGFRVSAEPWI